MILTKVCSQCGFDKPIEEFYVSRRNKTGIQSTCKTCQLSYTKNRYKKLTQDERFTRRRKQVLAQYGLTFLSYGELVAQQQGLCAICGNPETQVTHGSNSPLLAVDHDHNTGEVRGLLCAQCNQGLGKFRNDPDLLRKAAEYLEGLFQDCPRD